jgi:hypothetical protein
MIRNRVLFCFSVIVRPFSCLCVRSFERISVSITDLRTRKGFGNANLDFHVWNAVGKSPFPFSKFEAFVLAVGVVPETL